MDSEETVSRPEAHAHRMLKRIRVSLVIALRVAVVTMKCQLQWKRLKGDQRDRYRDNCTLSARYEADPGVIKAHLTQKLTQMSRLNRIRIRLKRISRIFGFNQ